MNDVATSHTKTFHWLYEDSLVQFSRWLRDKQNAMGPIFWVEGKPGSGRDPPLSPFTRLTSHVGKSTLMKFAMRDRRTIELLNTSEQFSWLLVGFFFHDRGSLAQKSLAAMLKEILRQILVEFNQLWHVVKPLYLQLTESQHTKSPRWDTETLEQALLVVTQQCLVDARICIFLDALDEHAGDNEKLASLLFKLTKNTQESKTELKICVASRSWTVFANHFGSCPQFAIHEHTREDIRLYTADMLSQAHMGPGGRTGRSRKAETLAEQVTNRARGVFIWVRLVVAELAKGIRDGTPLVELEDQLSKMPQELKDLYINTLKRVEPEYHEETHIMLQIALCSFSPLPLKKFLQCTFYSRRNKALKDCGTEHEMLRYLTSRSGGLLEAGIGDNVLDEDGSRQERPQHSSDKLSKVEAMYPCIYDGDATSANSASKIMSRASNPKKTYYVQFIHQTVKEFVRDYGYDPQLQSLASAKGSGHLHLLRYYTRSHDSWSRAERLLFDHAKIIDDELPQETEMMISALNRLNVNKYVKMTGSVPNSWAYFEKKEDMPILSLAVAANLATFVRRTIESYPSDSESRSTLDRAGLLHIAACGPKIVKGQDERLPMIKLLLELGISADSRISGLSLLPPPLRQSLDQSASIFADWTPLSLILSRQYPLEDYLCIQIAEELLKYGADPDVMIFSDVHDWKSTPLQECIRFEGPEMINLCLQYAKHPFGTERYPLVSLVPDLPPVVPALFRRDLEIRRAVRNHVASLDQTWYENMREDSEDAPYLVRKWRTANPVELCVLGGLLGVICTGFGV